MGHNLDLGVFLHGIERIGINFGINYADESGRVKTNALFDELVKARWSTERYSKTIEWILRNHKYPNWTIADFFSAPMQKLYSYSHFLITREKAGKYFEKEVDWYNIGGLRMYALKREGLLPFPQWSDETEKRDEPDSPIATKEQMREAFSKIQWGGN